MEDVEVLIERARKALEKFSKYSQEDVDRIFQAMAEAVIAHRLELAKMAVEETGIGLVEDKMLKIHYAAEYTVNKYRDMKTCGVIERDEVNGIAYIAEPVGVILILTPVTNPVSTVVHNILIALKARNVVIVSPHPRAARSTCYAAKIMYEAARRAGAPEYVIQCIERPSIELAQKLMKHRGIDLILATGGKGVVEAAYSSGNPAIGVGPGNVPVYIHSDADIAMAANYILMSKTFDWGILCCAESTIIVHRAVAERLRKEMERLGAYFLSEEEAAKLRSILFLGPGKPNTELVGKSAKEIAARAGIWVPEHTRVLVVPVKEVGRNEILTAEKLFPVLAFYVVDDWVQGLEAAKRVLDFDGLGHTAIVYTRDRAVLEAFSRELKVSRLLVNTPGSFGGIGDLYNFKLEPSLTLGCGTWGKNITTDNITPRHLINIKRVVERRENMQWLKVPPKIYYKYGALEYAFNDEVKGRFSRAVIITDPVIYRLYAKRVADLLEDMGLDVDVYYGVETEPSIANAMKALEFVREFKPDLLVALGGGSVLDVAKGVWIMYEQPDVDLRRAALRFMDIRKRVYRIKPLGTKAALIAIPTTSGTGSEVTPFIILKDEMGRKLTITYYEALPTIAIVDPQFVEKLPPRLVAISGFDALTHALEAYVSVYATPFTDPYALKAIQMIFQNLEKSYREGTLEAREAMHYAATLAGIAFANAFLGLAHGIAHALGSFFDIPHGVACALAITHVMRYNAVDAPTRNTAWPQYKYYNVAERYAEIARAIGLEFSNVREGVEKLIEAVERLRKSVGLPSTLKELGIKESEFLEKLDAMAEMAFEEQCTYTNPRHPLISEVKELLIKIYYGDEE
ncbi:MAG TPA: bifunctional acetaldehyde-CoA/alcohol dehydrogenase [Ignisphaera aggregans]|uniref:alcohol dehydrogenase n=1 Tax=Ignisphaera aggregans TaxID=334771 RepID=A0A832Z215_9CREN|nr:bifunctional acetaldehyde-CoA/alcohol dehydrogenase [Ignisphaera aggregans]